MNLPISHQAGILITTLFDQTIELIAWSRLQAMSQPTMVRLATLLRLNFRQRIIVRMATQMKERTGSSARMMLLALLGAKVYENIWSTPGLK